MQQLKTFKENNQFTFKQLGILFGVGSGTVQHWCYGIRSMPGSSKVLLKLYTKYPHTIKKVSPDL